MNSQIETLHPVSVSVQLSVGKEKQKETKFGDVFSKPLMQLTKAQNQKGVSMYEF